MTKVGGAILAGGVGSAVASFLNVVVVRASWRRACQGQSRCDHCQKKLSWWEKIPVFSFFWLKGHCRGCQAKIPWWYPLTEATLGLLFALVFYRSPTIFSLLVNWLVVASFYFIFLFDLLHQIIPDEALVSLLLTATLAGRHHFGAGIAVASFLLALYWLTRGKGLGFGDVKLAFLIGYFLGWPAAAVSVYLAFLTGGAIGAILLLSKKARWKTKIPFAPFLTTTTIVVWLWGPAILK